MTLVKFWLDFATISGKLLRYEAWPWNIFGFFLLWFHRICSSADRAIGPPDCGLIFYGKNTASDIC